MKVSVIVSTKNEEKNIEACLRSIRNQSLKDFEVVLSDAGSKDKTVKIAKNYVNKIVVKKTNVAAGRNLGAMVSSGDILVFVDADTILLPDTLEKVVEAFGRKKVVGAGCSALPLTAEGRYVGIYMFYNSFAKASVRIGKPQIAGFFCAYRRSAFERVGGFDDKVGILEDFHLSRKISSQGKVVFVGSALVMTSHRRLAKWGMNVPRRYMHAWLKMLLTGRSFSHEWYNSIR